MTVVVVIGASGFVGGAIVDNLRAMPGTSVRAGSRRGGHISGQPIMRLNLLDPESLRPTLEGADVVVNCVMGDRATIVDGARSLAAVSAKARIRRIVHLSSIAVYGNATGRVDEDTPILPDDQQARSYAGWKASAEHILADSGLDLVRLRPGIIYGAGSKLWVEALARRINTGRWGVFGDAADGICNPVHVSDVAAAVRCALSTPAAAGQAFNIDGGTPLTWNAWFSRFAAAMGAPTLQAHPPGTLQRRSRLALPAKAAARLLPPLRALLASTMLAAPSSSELALFALNATYPADKARAVLGWSPSISLDDGLDDSVRWLRRQRLAV